MLTFGGWILGLFIEGSKVQEKRKEIRKMWLLPGIDPVTIQASDNRSDHYTKDKVHT
jgi:hypothetical protein